MAGETEVPVILKIYAEKTGSVDATLAAAQKRFQSLAESVGGIAQSAAAMSGGVAAAFGGLVGGAVNVAGQFEQLEAKLTSVLGSSEAAAQSMQRAVQFAASTPFDVQSMVSATVTLEAFGQSSERVLPLAANLAAAFGRSMGDVSVILGKAFSGGLEGFESLRNSFGISNALLQKYGAELTKTGSIAISTGAQLDKARGALERIINTRFGDATARQSKTLFGALSNVGDAASNLAASFGKTLLPAFTTIAGATSTVLGALNKIPDPIKGVIAAFAALTAGLAGVVAITAGTFAGLLGVSAALAGMSTALPGVTAGLALTTGALNTMTASAIAAKGAFTALAANPLALAIGAAVAVFGMASVAVKSWEERLVAAGNTATAQANQFREVNVSLKAGIALLNEANAKTGKKVDLVGDSVKQMAALKAAFASASPAEFAAAMDKAKIQVEDFKTKLKEADSALNGQKGRLALLREELEKLSLVQPGIQAKTGIPAANLEKIEQLKERMSQLTFELGRSEAAKAFFQGAIDKAAELSARLDPLIQQNRMLSTLTDLSKSVGSTQALRNALADLDAQILRNSQTAEVGAGGLDELLQKYRALGEGPNVAPIRALLQEQIDRYRERASILEALDKQDADRVAEAQRREELAFRASQVMSQAPLRDELRYIQERLRAAAAGTEEAVSLRERERDLKAQILQREEADARKAEAARKELERKAAEEKAAAAKKAHEALAALNKDTQNGLGAAVTNEEKLAVVKAGIANIEAARQRGLLDETEATDQLNALTNQRADLEREINQQQLSRAQSMAGLELQALQQHLELLNAQKSAYGETSALRQEILATEQKILAAKFSAIDDQMKADLAANMSQADAARKKELAVTSLLEQETIRRINLEKQGTKAVSEEAEKQFSIREKFSRLGGKNSPLISLGELSSQLSFLPNFSLDSPSPKRPGDGLRDQGPPQLQLGRVRSQLSADVVEGQRLQKGEKGRFTEAINTADRANRGLPAGDMTNNYVTLQNQTIDVKNPKVVAAMRTIIDEYFQEGRHKSA